MLFQSTPSARRATKAVLLHRHEQFISIHALREEGDQSGRLHLPNDTISIHALREEGDAAGRLCGVPAVEFQSTPSARRATCPNCL